MDTMFPEIVILVMITLRSVSSLPSSDEWYRLDDALYLVDNITRLDYDRAQSLCQDYGANLPRVDSDEIQSFLTTFITPPFSSTRCFWIGADDREVEGQFTWLDGTPVRHNGWAIYQPDDARENQDCACLWSNQNQERHGRWDDNICTSNLNLICQKGVYNFQLRSDRSNPGYAYVYCAVDVDYDGEKLSPNDVRLSVGQNLSSTRSIPYSSTSFDGEFRNNSFVIDDLYDDDKIFCHVDELPRNASSLSLAEFPPIDFYALPALTSSPIVSDTSSTSVKVSWSSWVPCLDDGEGPVIGYLIYLQTIDKEWEEVGGIDSAVVGSGSQRIMEFSLTGLEPVTEYNISVSTIRDGPGGEGPRGPHETVRTNVLENERQFGTLGESSLIWILFGVSVAANIVLVVVMVIICRKQREKKLSSLRAGPPLPVAPTSDQYEVPIKPIGDDDEHIYEGFQRTESRSKESLYLSIDNPNKVEYVNVPP